MNIAAILKVFRHSSLVTARREYKISRVFPSGRAASKARYRYHCTESGVTIYSRHTKAGTNKFAVVGK